jgi:hypothetical protein
MYSCTTLNVSNAINKSIEIIADYLINRDYIYHAHVKI